MTAPASSSPALVEAKAAADLTLVCAAIGVDVNALTEQERFLWLQAFRRGAVYGLEIAKVEIRQMGAA